MKRAMAVVVTLLLASMLMPGPAAAQHSPPGGPPTPGDTPGSGMHGKPGDGTPPGMMGGAMMCPMMSMMGRQADPRAMQMHGEMMKAMGDIMMKYGKMAEGGGTR